MKTISLVNHSPRTRGQRAMTLVEMMTTMGLFTVMVAALVSANMFGLRQDELVCSKLGASDQARINFDLMLHEIRAGKNVQIGTGQNTNFMAITNGVQAGDTIQILPSTNIGYYIYYYFLTNAPSNPSWLVRVAVSPTNTVSNVVCQSITNVTSIWNTNSMCFQALGFNGSNWVTLTNDPTFYSTHNYIVSCLLQFYQYQYPLTRVGTNGNYLYDYYQLQLQAARRSL
jgi:hypothetical protein